MKKPIILRAAELPEWANAELDALFTVLPLPKDSAEASDFLLKHGADIRGIALRKTKIDADVLDKVPALEIISSYSAGLDNVDVASAKSRGIRIENTSHILADDVANLAIGLALALTRGLVNADAYVRSGDWARRGSYELGRSISRMKVGVVGLGMIGLAVAKRLQALGAAIAYFGPNRKDVDFPYYDDIARLAADSDMLILTCPLSPATHHVVDAAVIDALGPHGYIVNVSRGPVIDEVSLIAALEHNRIAGAALDVFENEPSVPEQLMQDRRLVLAPHIGSATHETRQRMAENVIDTLAEHFRLPVDRPHRVVRVEC